MVSAAGETRKENLDVADELVDESLVEFVCEESLIRPELNDFDMLNPWKLLPILDLSALVFGEGLGHFLSILG